MEGLNTMTREEVFDVSYPGKQPEEELSREDYEEAPKEIVERAKRLIRERHGHLQEARITYQAYTKKGMEYRGSTVPGRLYKLSDREKAQFDKDFMLVVSQQTWEMLDEEEKDAAMDWILCFGIKKTDGSYKIAEPDFSGFYSNIAEYGLWNMQLQKVKNILRQVKLPFDEPA